MPHQLLTAFTGIFEGQRYLHRRSNLGDFVVSYLYEDLLALGSSPAFVQRVQSTTSVMNSQNKAQGVPSRRGDGTFGQRIPSIAGAEVPGFQVLRGRVATVEIGAEVKILQKAMIKQIDRVMNDLRSQVAEFRRISPDVISVAVVGINHASFAVSYEGDRAFRTDGRSNKHPYQECAEAERRIREFVRPHYDELVFLRYSATNDKPYAFQWMNEGETRADYDAALIRISSQYQRRFGY